MTNEEIYRKVFDAADSCYIRLEELLTDCVKHEKWKTLGRVLVEYYPKLVENTKKSLEKSLNIPRQVIDTMWTEVKKETQREYAI